MNLRMIRGSGPRIQSGKGKTGRLFGILILIMAVSVACAIPSFSPRETPVAAPTILPTIEIPRLDTTAQAEPTEVAVPYSPDLVEVSPPNRSDLFPNISPVLYFNQEMNRPSVEHALRIQPSSTARLEWLDDATLRVIPTQPLDLDQPLQLTISEDAQAANGKKLTAPVQVVYRALNVLKVTQRLPEPRTHDVDPSSAVVVTFNRPVVALGADPSAAPPAFTLEAPSGVDQPAGRAEWLNTSTYIFYPRPSLFGGVQYTVRFNPSLVGLDGRPVTADETGAEWSFYTSAPALLSLQPGAERLAELDDVIVLTFNQPMDTASVEAGFSLIRPDSSPVSGVFSWNDARTEVTFKPAELLERGSVYGLVLYGSSRSLGGTPLGQDFAASLQTVPQFGVIQTNPPAGQKVSVDFGQGMITLVFGSPVKAGQDLNRLITVSSPVNGLNANRSSDGYQIYITGYFQPGSSYTLAISPDLVDRWGAALGLPYSFTFGTSPARPALTVAGFQTPSRTVFIPYGETSIPAESTNIERLELASGEVSLDDFIAAGRDWQGLLNWESQINSRWVSLLYPDANKTEKIDIPIHPAGDLLAPGLYFLNMDATPVIEGINHNPMLLVVSPNQMVLKTSLRQAFVWVVKTADQQPVEGAAVSIYDQSAGVVASCQTDAQGICQAELPPRDDPEQAYYAVIGKPGDADFSLTADRWNEGVAPWSFGIGYARENQDPIVYLYTDRSIYQPGQVVNLRAVVRNKDSGRYSPADLQELTLDVISPYDPLTAQTPALTSLRLSLDAFGAGSGVYTLPENARPGDYILRTHESNAAEIVFHVAEYRKPEIDAQVKFLQPDRLVGQDLEARGQTKYFFGAPAGNVAVRWSLFGDVSAPDLPGGLMSGRVDTSWMDYWPSPGGLSFFAAEGQTTTLPDGSLAISVPWDSISERLQAFSGNRMRMTLEVTLEDESGLAVSARDSMYLHPSPFYIGLRPETWMVSAGEEITYSIQTLDWQSQRLGNQDLFARFYKVTWKEDEGAGPFNLPTYTMEKSEVGSTEFRTSEYGEARLAFLPAEPGTFMIEVTGESGALTQALIWVGGVGQASWPDVPNQRLLLRGERDQYAPGESAKIFIPNPFDDSALALITIERAKVMRSQVVEITGSNAEIDLPLAADDAPNVYVSVTLIGRTHGRPDFRIGYLDLQVDPSANYLNLQVQFSPLNPLPGQDVTITLRARDAAKNPVQASLSLALVDKAVLALADPNSAPIEEAFYGQQYLGVQTGLSLAAYSARSLYSPPGRGGGGAEGLLAQPQLREKFEDTAYWNGSLETDITGVAQVTLRLPDNLTTWQADVRGLTADASVGGVRADLVVSKPLLIRTVTPGFVVQGDHLELAAVVHNNTADPLQASVRLEGAGFSMDDLNQAVQVINIPAGGRGRVSWWGTVQDVGALDLIFEAESGDLRDGARPEGGTIPVRRYLAPQVFATSGVLPEEGAHLELISLPRSFTPIGGDLRVELSPSLSATVLDGLQALDEFPRDFTEPVISSLLPNLLMYSALRDLQLSDEALLSELHSRVERNVDWLVLQQNEDGGWGWAPGLDSSPYLSTYAFYGMARAYQAGIFVDPTIIQKSQQYLVKNLVSPGVQVEAWRLDQLAFQYFVLQMSGGVDLNFTALYGLREKLSPWGKAFLALGMDGATPQAPEVKTLLADLQSSASRSATGANWQDANPGWFSWSTPNFTTAVVVYSLARLEPESQVLPDALRYLAAQRKPSGSWNSSYESAWALAALVEMAKTTGDLQAGFDFSVSINASPLMTGAVNQPSAAVHSISAMVGLSGLRNSQPNALEIQRGAGAGNLYYRAYLEISRPAEDAPAVSSGLGISRDYFVAGQDCSLAACQPITLARLSDSQPLLVRLTLNVPEEMYNVIVEDYAPAGVEILDPRLKTTSQSDLLTGQAMLYSPENPFEEGWGWWLFQNPQVYSGRIRWVVAYLPAGTYQLTYRITPFLAGEFRLIPAHAYQYYFPEVEGSSAGGILTIQ